MVENKKETEPKEFSIWANPYADFRYASIYVKKISGGTFTIPVFNSVEYRQTYGTPRKLWNPQNPKKAIYEAYGIEGIFDAEYVKWKTAKMKVKDLKNLEEKIIDVQDWSFSLYEGDELYQGDKMVFSSKRH